MWTSVDCSDGHMRFEIPMDVSVLSYDLLEYDAVQSARPTLGKPNSFSLEMKRTDYSTSWYLSSEFYGVTSQKERNLITMNFWVAEQMSASQETA
jgi:hypothetical protein